ncbi:hypothetical protein G3M81_22835 [Bacillus paralicheniformis]|uniref:hypothetical protein n=1 Tax=Bacillus TaxID=1386 RepID=UPI0013EE49DE|nr:MULTISPECIES: hypothetical protein [Bacillus]QII26929.1 hypothetical protein G3M80_20745 [Bacillus altitudinis]QII51397.1 hypothetical protein G3M81_22835 [Bacillus paralicheniformis]
MIKQTESKRECHNPQEIVDIKLYPVKDFITPYVLTVYYKEAPVFEEGDQVWSVIRSILNSNQLDMSNVTILYYYDGINTLNEVHQWIFDVYLDKYVGDTIDIIPIDNLSEEVKSIHSLMMKKLSDK